MSKLTNLFEDFRHYQGRKVDSPSYEPLGQTILASEESKEELKKQNHNEHQKSYYEKNKEKINEYHKNYYEKNKERLKEYNRNYWRKTHESPNPKDELSGFQKKVYDYLLNQYRKGEEPARGTQIARALGISANSVYTATFQLTKKGYLGRGTYGKYLLLKFPNSEDSKEEEVIYDDFDEAHNNPVGRNYIDELADKISGGLITQNKKMFEEILQLREENQKMKDTLENIKKAWIEHERNTDAYYKKWNDSYSDLDKIIMNR